MPLVLHPSLLGHVFDPYASFYLLVFYVNTLKNLSCN